MNTANKNQPLVSVVTPVYNGEKFLAECIESVLAQTWKNWEYVILDNCCTDSTPEIIRRFAEKDSRIRIVSNQACLPIIENWNRSMTLLSPESRYCKVIHADDILFPECIERMVGAAEQHDNIALVGSYRLHGNRVTCNGLTSDETVLDGKELCRRTLRAELNVFGSPSSLLIRSDAVRKYQPFYDETFFHADKAVCFNILTNSDFAFVHQVLQPLACMKTPRHPN